MHHNKCLKRLPKMYFECNTVRTKYGKKKMNSIIQLTKQEKWKSIIQVNSRLLLYYHYTTIEWYDMRSCLILLCHESECAAHCL